MYRFEQHIDFKIPINSIINNIKFTRKYSETQPSILDILIMKKAKIIESNVRYENRYSEPDVEKPFISPGNIS